MLRLLRSFAPLYDQFRFYKHLSEVHFKDKLFELLKDAFLNKPLKCIHCDYTTGNKINLSVHLGVHHRLVVKFYNEIIRQSSDEEWRTKDVIGRYPPGSRKSCSLCGDRLNISVLASHMAEVHFPDINAFITQLYAL